MKNMMIILLVLGTIYCTITDATTQNILGIKDPGPPLERRRSEASFDPWKYIPHYSHHDPDPSFTFPPSDIMEPPNVPLGSTTLPNLQSNYTHGITPIPVSYNGAHVRKPENAYLLDRAHWSERAYAYFQNAYRYKNNFREPYVYMVHKESGKRTYITSQRWGWRYSSYRYAIEYERAQTEYKTRNRQFSTTTLCQVLGWSESECTAPTYGRFNDTEILQKYPTYQDFTYSIPFMHERPLFYDSICEYVPSLAPKNGIPNLNNCVPKKKYQYLDSCLQSTRLTKRTDAERLKCYEYNHIKTSIYTLRMNIMEWSLKSSTYREEAYGQWEWSERTKAWGTYAQWCPWGRYERKCSNNIHCEWTGSRCTAKMETANVFASVQTDFDWMWSAVRDWVLMEERPASNCAFHKEKFKDGNCCTLK